MSDHMINAGYIGNRGDVANTSNMNNMGTLGSMENMSEGSMSNMSKMGFKESTSPMLYEADPKHTAMVMEVRDRIMSMCGGYMHKFVCVQTLDGHVFEGMIVHIDRTALYLQCSMHDPRAFMNPYNAILPLVLYELLVVSLL